MARLNRTAARGVFACALASVVLTTGCRGAKSVPPRLAPDVAGLSASAADSLGAAAQAEERYRLSLVYDRRAAELDPSRITALQRVGISLISMGEVAEALNWLMRARALDSTAVVPLYWTGIAYWTLGDFAAAERIMTRVAAMRPNSAAPPIIRTYAALAQGQWAEAHAASEHAVSVAPGMAVALLTKADALLYSGKLEEARVWVDSALMVDPAARNGFPGRAATTSLAFILTSQGQRDSAEVLLRASARADSLRLAEGRDSQQYPYDLAAVAAIRGDVRTACDWLRRAAEGGWAKPALARRDPLLAAAREASCFERTLGEVERRLNAERARAP